MKEISVEEYKNILLDIMKYLDNLCRKNNICYSLNGGTAIGAMRHHGFIPWDDDIDIILDHDNYERLKDILKNTYDDRYFLLDENKPDNYYPFMKLIDKRTAVIEQGCKNISEYGAFIDIFEYNNAPNNGILRFMYYYRLVFWKKLLAGLSWDKNRADHKVLLFFRYLIASIFGKKMLFSHYEKICHKYNKKDCNYILSNWPTYGAKREINKKMWFKDFEYTDFEKCKLMISSNIDEMLTCIYGDYMQLPPKEQRISNHKMKAYWK